MKLKSLLLLVALLGVPLPPSADCRPNFANPPARRHPLPWPLLLRLGEEFSLRLGGSVLSSTVATPGPDLLSSSTPSAVSRALQHILQVEWQKDAEEEKGKRSDEPPISLDLTFHLLREVLQMARAEQVAQQADSNRRMMDTFGK
uniref:Corticotropin-releasing factor domain-containing protein n=2 Tax=Echeneis naucrates TaxID=173247 RepID=A0A665V5D1_ECHNA